MYVEDGGHGVCLSDVHQLVQKPASAAQMQFTHATRSPRAQQIAGSAVCGSQVDIAVGISTRYCAATEKSFLSLVLEGLCGATASLVERLDCSIYRARGTHSRADYCHDREREIAECFVLLSVVYND